MRKGRILIVEDETGVRETNAAHLARLGYEVFKAGTIAEAKKLAQETPPDLYLLDVMLPDGSGLDYCHDLRRYSTAPVIFLTCLDESRDIIRGIEEGGDAYLTKPYDLNVLAAQIMAQLRRAGLMGVGRVELPPLTVDLGRGEAVLEGKVTPLSQKEAQLLSYLATNAERSFTREELFRAVWGEGIDTGVVRKYISVIRKKMELDESSPIEIVATPGGRYLLTRPRFR